MLVSQPMPRTFPHAGPYRTVDTVVPPFLHNPHRSPSLSIRRERRTRGIGPLSIPLEPAQQPVRQPDDLGTDPPLPLAALLNMLDRMGEYPPLPIKLKDEQARKLPPLAGPLRTADLLPPPGRHRPSPTIVLQPSPLTSHTLPALEQQSRQTPAAAAAPYGPPAHDELVLHGARATGGFTHHALGEDLEADVAEARQAVPGYRGGPEGGLVGDAAAHGGEVGVGRGEEVERYGGGEDLLRQGGVEEGWEAGLQDAEGWEDGKEFG